MWTNFLSQVVQLLKSTNEIWCSLLLFALFHCVFCVYPIPPSSYFYPFPFIPFLCVRIININTKKFTKYSQAFSMIFFSIRFNLCIESMCLLLPYSIIWYAEFPLRRCLCTQSTRHTNTMHGFIHLTKHTAQ